jgi:hypothetical protein
MSSMMRRSARAELTMISAYSRWAAVSVLSCSRRAIPTMPFMGVRISWLTLARKRLLAWLASASSRVRAFSSRLACESSAVRSRTRRSRSRRSTSTSPWTRVKRLARDTAIENTKAAKPNGIMRRVASHPRSSAVSFRYAALRASAPKPTVRPSGCPRVHVRPTTESA